MTVHLQGDRRGADVEILAHILARIAVRYHDALEHPLIQTVFVQSLTPFSNVVSTLDTLIVTTLVTLVNS